MKSAIVVLAIVVLLATSATAVCEGWGDCPWGEGGWGGSPDPAPSPSSSSSSGGGGGSDDDGPPGDNQGT